MTRLLRSDLNMGLRASFVQLLITIAVTVFTLSPCASFSSIENEFTAAVSAFKAGKLEDARKQFLELESKYPDDPVLMLNLGLIAQKEKRLGAALALWRKALVANPTNDALLNAVEWTKPKLPKSEITHSSELWEDFRRTILTRVSPITVNIAAAAFLLLAGWRLLAWWGSRRRAIELETAAPPVPFGGFFLSAVFIVLLGISLAIFIDRLDVRGTILPAKVEVRSAPDATATPLFDLFEGMEVIVRDVRTVGEEQWRRITYPGGMTGWIRARDVMAFTDPSAHAWEQ